MSRFTRNLKQIQDPLKFREYCLNPLGLKVVPTTHFAKPQKIVEFVNFGIKIHRTEKPLDKNTFAVKIFGNKENITKLEIKQYLEKIYGLQVEKVNTINYMGKITKNHKGKIARREPDFKKAYIKLNEEIDVSFQKFDKM